MKREVQKQLLMLNQQFYDQFATAFSQTRRPLNPGFDRLLAALPQPCHRLLDVACGNGRFGRFLFSHKAIEAYVGIDYSEELLTIASTNVAGAFHKRDVSQPDCLHDLGTFDAIAFLAALHHIPGQENRARLLGEMQTHLHPDGRLLLATWQFRDSERQRRKIQPWSNIGLSAADVEENDYLLSWQRGGFSYRYVTMIDEDGIASLAAAAGFSILDQYRSDGREGNLSLYSILRKS